MTRYLKLTVTMAVGGLMLPPASTAAQTSPPPCGEVERFDDLDFWLGEWSVRVDGNEVGTNRIEKILNGCAVAEYWTAGDGSQGRSLFYFVPALGEWRQVWVTERATATGGVKEKRVVPADDERSVRFQGEIPLRDGRTYLDRTTLTPLAEGRVRQHIEISTDGGTTWRTTFDAVYVRRETG